MFSGVSKISVVKPKVLIYQLLDKIATKFQRIPTLSVSNNSAAVLPILHDVTGSQKFKMAADKPEIVIYRLPVEI